MSEIIHPAFCSVVEMAVKSTRTHSGSYKPTSGFTRTSPPTRAHAAFSTSLIGTEPHSGTTIELTFESYQPVRFVRCTERRSDGSSTDWVKRMRSIEQGSLRSIPPRRIRSRATGRVTRTRSLGRRRRPTSTPTSGPRCSWSGMRFRYSKIWKSSQGQLTETGTARRRSTSRREQ